MMQKYVHSVELQSGTGMQCFTDKIQKQVSRT